MNYPIKTCLIFLVFSNAIRAIIAQPFGFSNPGLKENPGLISEIEDRVQDAYPDLTSDQNGTWITVWESRTDIAGVLGDDNEVFYSKSTDNGRTWAEGKPLNNNFETDSADDLNPQIITDNRGTWICYWSSSENLNGQIGRDFDIIYSISTDAGDTWTNPAALRPDSDYDNINEMHLTMAYSDFDTWIICWTENYFPGQPNAYSEVYASRSVNNGQTWSTPMKLSTVPPLDLNTQWYSTVENDSKSNWIVVWYARNLQPYGMSNDIYLVAVRSEDDGLTWTDPVRLFEPINGQTTLDLYPELYYSGGNHWLLAWSSTRFTDDYFLLQNDLTLSSSIDNGLTWSEPRMMIERLDVPDSNYSGYQFAFDNSGNWVATWIANFGSSNPFSSGDLLVSRSFDNAQTWTTPQALSYKPFTQRRRNRYPTIATDQKSSWVIVWQSSEYYDEIFPVQFGGEEDILFTYSNYDNLANFLVVR